MSSNPPKVRDEPYASVTTLAEYLEASAVRRRSLLQKLKYPDPFSYRSYAASRPAIAQAIRTGDRAHLDGALSTWCNDDSGTEYQKDLRQRCIDAAEAFLEMIDGYSPDDLPDLEPFELEDQAFRDREKIMISGVTVSVAPDLLVTDTSKDTRGAIRLHLSKTAAFNDNQGAFAATLIDWWVSEHGGGLKSRLDHCMLIDVFTGRIHTAPKAFKMRRREIAAACQEMADLWPLITPR